MTLSLGNLRIKIDHYLLILFALATLVVAYAWYIIPHGPNYGGPPYFEGSDSAFWFKLTESIFEYKDSVARHRPFFALIAWAMYNPIFYFFPTIDVPFFLNLVWRIQNIFFYLLSIYCCFSGTVLLTKSRHKAFYATLFLVASSHCFAWLMQPIINLQGKAIHFISLYLLIDYIQKKSTKKLVIYSLIYGLFMLGKGQMNILVAIGLATLFLNRKSLKDFVIFTGVQFIPLVLWVIFLKAIGSGYRNYELEWHGAFYWLKDVDFKSFVSIVLFFKDMVTKLTSALIIGLGPFSFFVTIGFPFLIWREKLGKFLMLYLIATTLFLYVVTFLMVRHAGDFSPVTYLGYAYLIDYIRHKIKPNLFYPGLIVLTIAMFMVNLNPEIYLPIY